MNAEEQLQAADERRGRVEISGRRVLHNGAVTETAVRTNALGEPLTVDEVAALLGCSPWTVRQRYLRQGIPYLQARPRGKLVFFRDQVIAWIEKRQRQKGGVSR